MEKGNYEGGTHNVIHGRHSGSEAFHAPQKGAAGTAACRNTEGLSEKEKGKR